MLNGRIKGEYLKETIAAMTALIDEAKLNITEKGISTKTVDAANVAMVVMTLNANAFERFEGSEGTIALNLKKMENVIEMVEKGDVVELELDEKEHKLRVEFSGLAYALALLDPGGLRNEPQKIPNLALPIDMSISGLDFKIGMKASEKISEYVKLGMKDGRVIISADGDTDSVNYVIPADRIKVSKTADAVSLYAVEYLHRIHKVAEKTEEVSLIFGKDYPVKIKFDIAEKNGTVEYMIAPRVESE